MSLHESTYEIKPQFAKTGYSWLMAKFARKDVYIALIIFTTGVTSFLIGRLSVANNSGEVFIKYNDNGIVKDGSTVLETNTIKSSVTEDTKSQDTIVNTSEKGMYVGSKNSNKFHLPWCSGAQRISEENKVWFQTKDEALAMGYIPAANCKGI